MLISYFIIFFIGFKNSAKFFFQRYSLSTVNGYYSIINFISISLATFFTRLRSFKVTMERQLGYQFSDFQDAFAVSSLFLTLFKLYIFLVYLEQVSPIVSIPFLAIMGFFSLRYSLILVIRDLVVALFVNPLFNIKNQLEVFDYSKLFKLEFYLYCLFVILISFRVLIYGEPILFFFLNSFFLYYLLFHKLLFIVFFYSLILSISRFVFLSSDYTLIKLYHKLNNISHNKDLINRTKRIKFTRKNIIILVSWITRAYEFRDVLLIYREDDREKSYCRDSTNKLIDYENVVDNYIQSENSIFIAAIEKYNSWRLPQSKAKINIIHTFRILTLYDMQVEIKVKYINFLFYLSGLVLILLYTIQPEEYLEIDYVAAFVSFKLSKISHLKERTTVVSVKKRRIVKHTLAKS